MRLFKRRVSDPAPQLVSLAPINAEMDHTALVCQSNGDYADYQTVTAVPALVVVEEPPRKGQYSFLSCIYAAGHFRFVRAYKHVHHVKLRRREAFSRAPDSPALESLLVCLRI